MYRFDDRRPRPDVRRAASDRRQEARPSSPRAEAQPHIWFQPVFGAHILGQVAPERAPAAAVARAYAQPEARMPVRPRTVRTA